MISKQMEWSPDFLGIGAMKAATFWLYTCLEAHPEVCMGGRKEIHFFDTPSSYKKGIKWYESFFLQCDKEKKQGEITPGYLCTPDAAKLIWSHYPDVKLFACLRNPVERAYSHYRFNVIRKGNMSIYKSFEQALEKEDSLVEMGMYCKQLKAYYELFPGKNILVVLYDDISADPYSLLATLYSFVGVDSTFVPEMAQTRKGVTGAKVMEYKIPFINPLLYRVRDYIRTRGLEGLLDKIPFKTELQYLVNKNRRVVDAKEGQKKEFPPLDQKIYDRLVPVFESDIKQLEELVGRDLSAWRSV